MAFRPSSSSDAKELAKIFRANISSLDKNTFGEDFESCLQRQSDFFVDLWEHDKYATESKLQAAMKLVWPKLDIALSKQTAKSVKSILSSIHYKKARMSSGQKSPSLQAFLARLTKEPQLPVQSARAAKSTPKAPALKQLSSIAALYGVSSSGSKDGPMSQVTVSDDLAASQITIIDSEVDAPTASNGYYFDHNQCCLVKVISGPDGQKVTAMSKMRPGHDGFAEAVFEDGDVQLTEITNLECFGGLKRPAAAPTPLVILKKPATAKKPASARDGSADDLDGDDGSSDGGSIPDPEVQEPSLPDVQQPSLPRLPSKHSYEDGTEVKLGKYTGQSYITYKEPGKAKFTLLIACSDLQAARNGKKHAEVMDSVWSFVVSSPSLPEKAVCKQHVLDILSQK